MLTLYLAIRVIAWVLAALAAPVSLLVVCSESAAC